MTESTLLWAWRLFAVFGIGGILFWMGKTIRAMQGTVEAQKETIRAQAAKIDGMDILLKTMDAVLRSTDEQNMLARLKAHKEFVEHEKEAAVRRLTEQFEQEKAKMFSGRHVMIGFIQYATNSLPYVPLDRRTEFIDQVELDHGHIELAVKATLLEIARSAPDLSSGAYATFSTNLRESTTFPRAYRELLFKPKVIPADEEPPKERGSSERD